MGQSKNTTLIEAVRRTLQGDKAEIGDALGICENAVYKMGLNNDENGFLKHLRRAVALVKHTKNYSIIETLARQCGGHFCREPKRLPKLKQETEIASFNLKYALLLHTFSLLMDEPTPTLHREFSKLLNEHIAEIMSMRKKSEINNRQTSLIDELFEN